MEILHNFNRKKLPVCLLCNISQIERLLPLTYIHFIGRSNKKKNIFAFTTHVSLGPLLKLPDITGDK